MPRGSPAAPGVGGVPLVMKRLRMDPRATATGMSAASGPLFAVVDRSGGDVMGIHQNTDHNIQNFGSERCEPKIYLFCDGGCQDGRQCSPLPTRSAPPAGTTMGMGVEWVGVGWGRMVCTRLYAETCCETATIAREDRLRRAPLL